MNGYQITLYMEQGRRHRGHDITDWLLRLVRELGLHGATVETAMEGVGRSGRVHSARFVELADQPIQFVIVVTAAESDLLFSRLRAEELKLFYVKQPVEFGTTGG